MKNADIKFDISGLKSQFAAISKKISMYKFLLFFLAVAALYGYIIWRINVYSNVPASQSEVSAKSAAQPRIDSDTVQKIQNLQDNSVSVQSLFDQARDNPFQE